MTEFYGMLMWLMAVVMVIALSMDETPEQLIWVYGGLAAVCFVCTTFIIRRR